MLHIKMHAMYDHFPDHHPVDGEPFIDMWSDSHVFGLKGGKKNVALLLEPKSMLRDAYEFVEANAGSFAYIFTHDSSLLDFSQSRMLNWGDVWLTTDSPKTKGISIITSPKNWCPLHNARIWLCDCFQDNPKVDVFRGDWNNPMVKTIDAKDYLEEYKYSIIIENDLDDWWYTEKILNCFSTKTVPIYVGASKIGELFNANGIIQVPDFRMIPEIVSALDIDGDYAKRTAAINDNFERVKPYAVNWKERFFRDYGKMLEDLQNE